MNRIPFTEQTRFPLDADVLQDLQEVTQGVGKALCAFLGDKFSLVDSTGKILYIVHQGEIFELRGSAHEYAIEVVLKTVKKTVATGEGSYTVLEERYVELSYDIYAEGRIGSLFDFFPVSIASLRKEIAGKIKIQSPARRKKAIYTYVSGFRTEVKCFRDELERVSVHIDLGLTFLATTITENTVLFVLEEPFRPKDEFPFFFFSVDSEGFPALYSTPGIVRKNGDVVLLAGASSSLTLFMPYRANIEFTRRWS